MREHEVPTHVQAEDKVLLWFTFPQIVAVVAVCAVVYGVYRYFPFGPSEFRLGIAILLGVAGIALTVGKVGGRGCPWWPPTCLSSTWGPGATPAPPPNWPGARPHPALEAKPDPLRLLAKKAAGGVGKAVKAAKREGRPPFRPHSWFGKRRPKGAENAKGGKAPKPNNRETQGRKPWYKLLAVSGILALAGLLALTVITIPSSALADDPDDETPGWGLGKIYFEPPDPVPGRRIHVEKLAVTGDTATVSLRAAHDLDLKMWVFGGRTGRTLKMGANAIVHSGKRKTYNLTLDRPSPSFTFSWTDSPVSSTGAGSGLFRGGVPEERLASLPSAQLRRRLCDVEVTSLEWRPGAISGVIASECITDTRQEVELPVYGGYFSQTVSACWTPRSPASPGS